MKHFCPIWVQTCTILDPDEINLAQSWLKNNKDFILDAVKQDVRVLKYVDEKLRNDWDFVMALVKEDERAVDYVGLKIKDDIKNHMKTKQPLTKKALGRKKRRGRNRNVIANLTKRRKKKKTKKSKKRKQKKTKKRKNTN